MSNFIDIKNKEEVEPNNLKISELYSIKNCYGTLMTEKNKKIVFGTSLENDVDLSGQIGCLLKKELMPAHYPDSNQIDSEQSDRLVLTFLINKEKYYIMQEYRNNNTGFTSFFEQ